MNPRSQSSILAENDQAVVVSREDWERAENARRRLGAAQARASQLRVEAAQARDAVIRLEAMVTLLRQTPCLCDACPRCTAVENLPGDVHR